MNAFVKSCLMTCVVLGAGQSVMAVPKNIIVILTDDQGYGNLSCFGSKRIQSPNIDKLASEGMKMTNFCMASSVCSPSRAALLTGRMPNRAGVYRIFTTMRDDKGMAPYEITMAELLKEKGYATGIVGKWHLGHKPEFMPLNQGFDSYFGFPYSNGMTISKELALSPNIKLNDGYTMKRVEEDLKMYAKKFSKYKGLMPMVRGNEVVEYPVDQTTLTQRYTEEAVQFIQEHKDQPFFLYLAHSMPHKPIFASKRFQGTGPDEYSDSIHEIDWSVGEVIQALKDNGLDDDTFVIFTSDNGPASAGDAGELRGRKFTTYEGGLRVPTVIWAPGEVPAGVVCDELVSALDLFPTFAKYAGAAMPTDRIYDGVDMSDLFAGRTKTSPRKEMFYYIANQPAIDGVRSGDWKLLYTGERYKPGQGTDSVRTAARKPMLFNVKEDCREKTDLYQNYPEIVQDLKNKMAAFDAAVEPSPDAQP